MVDLAGAVDRIFKLVVEIKKAVKVAGLNMEYCKLMDDIVKTVKIILGERQNITVDESNVLSATMERLEEALKKACKLIEKCHKQNKNVFRRLFNASDMSLDLQQTHIEIASNISMLKLAKCFRQSASLRNIEETQGLIVQLLVVRLDDVPQEMEGTGLVQVSRISDSADDTSHSDGNESKRSKGKVLARGKAPADFLTGLEKYSLQELRAATSGFKEERIIGDRGAGGNVYQGKLKDEEVAIKCHLMFEPDEEAVKKLVEEFNLLSFLEHKNIIKLLGCRVPNLKSSRKYNKHVMQKGQDEWFLSVTKYMPEESLMINLYDNEKRKRIGWASLVQIVQGIANGVLYLHEEGVVHLDLKPSHILLDSDMTPKINDFGTARVLDAGVDCIKFGLRNPPPCTLGYTAPELMEEKATASTKSDVFSFGAIVIQTLRMCMCKPQDALPTSSDPTEWLYWVQNNNWIDIFDETRVTDEFEQTMARWLLIVALRCCQHNLVDRPSMSEVVMMLHADTIRSNIPWYEVLTQDNLSTLMELHKTKIVKALSVPRGVAERLLVLFHWTPSEVIKKWSQYEEGTCKEIGLRSRDDRAMKLDEGFSICKLCNKNLCNKKSTGSCDHFFCERCWGKYIKKEVNGQGQLCLDMQCPEPNCRAPVCREILEGMANNEDMKMYDKHARESYVQDSMMMKWCPGLDCDNVIKFYGCFGNDGVDVVCDRKHSSHWRCLKKAHQPDEQCKMEQD